MKIHYKGWTNWDTWNANSWLNNDESLYCSAIKCKKASDIEELFLDTFDTSAVNSFDGIDYSEVNWNQIYKNI